MDHTPDIDPLCQSVFDVIPLGVILYDYDGSVIAANPAAQRILGISIAQVMDFTRLDSGWHTIHEDGSIFTEADNPATRAMRTGEVVQDVIMGVYNVQSNGYCWINITATPHFNQPGQPPDIIIVTFEEITAHRQAKKQIFQLNRLYNTLSQINQTIVRAKTREELFISVCQVAVEYGGLSLAWVGLYDPATGEVKPVASSEELPYHEVNAHEPPYQHGLIGTVLRTGQITFSTDIESDASIQHWHAAASERGYLWGQLSAVAIPLHLNGSVIGLLGLASPEKDLFIGGQEQRLLEEIEQDISFALEQIEAEKIKRQWADAFEQCAHGIAIDLPNTHRILTCNPAFARLQGRAIEDISSMPVLSLYAPEDHGLVLQAIDRADQTGSATFEAHMLRQDGSTYPVQMDLVSVRDANGHLIYRVATQQDITERRRAAEFLRQSEEKFATAFLTSPDSININRASDGVYIDVNQGFCSISGYTREEAIGKSTLELNIWADPEERTRMLEELVRTGELNNREVRFCSRDGKAVSALISSRVLMINGEKCILSVTRDMTAWLEARKDLHEAHARLEQAYEATLQGWANALQLREKETAEHSRRVTELTLQMAGRLGIQDPELTSMHHGALLHDIGKVGVPDHILLKPGPLSSDEWQIMRQHPRFAYDLLYEIPYLRPALDIPFCHHERWDGSGYPRKLKGEEIPLAARIFAVVDVYDALLNDRPYRPGWPENEVLDYLMSQSGIQFDPQIVAVFFEVIASGGPGVNGD